MKKYLLPETGNFYKANLHCHTTISDGKFTPEEVKKTYQAHGYSIIAYTDHNLLVPHNDLRDESFLPLTSVELDVRNQAEPWCKTASTCHLCFIAPVANPTRTIGWHREKYVNAKYAHNRALAIFDENEPDYERVYTAEGINDLIARGREAGFFVTYNHPVWSVEGADKYLTYHGMHAMEIYNNSSWHLGCDEHNPRVYDDMLQHGERIFAVATDDNHSSKDECGGFTVIKAEALEYSAVMDALFAGSFYASTGPEIRALWLETNEAGETYVHIECSDAHRITYNTPTRRASVAWDCGSAAFKVSADDVYFRLTVVDAAGNFAHTNAYFTEEWL